MKKILVIYTGGTIGSSVSKNVRFCDTEKNAKLLTTLFKNSGNPFKNDVLIKEKVFLNTLSENMDISKWNKLISEFKNSGYENFDGVIITHGTDTLSYTSALFGVLFSGIEIPVLFVSAFSPLSDKNSNGLDNFSSAIEFICERNQKGIFVSYRNENDEKAKIHKGYALMECNGFSNNFYSTPKAENPSGNKIFANDLEKLDAKVPVIKPYVGINYDLYDIKNADAVLHTTYHSKTVETKSFNRFCERCKSENVPLFLAPADKSGEIYESFSQISDYAIPLGKITVESAYAKILTAFSLYKNDIKKAIDFTLN